VRVSGVSDPAWKVGQKVTAAGISVGGKVVDLGGNLGRTSGSSAKGLPLPAWALVAGLRLQGRSWDRLQKLLAPRLAQVGKDAAVVGEWVGKRHPVSDSL